MTHPAQKGEILLGVDGGGTKTKACVASVDQSTHRIQVLGEGVSASSNPRSIGFENAFSNLQAAIDTALQASVLSYPEISSVCLSLSGFGRKEEQEQLIRWARSKFTTNRIRAIDDVAPLALAAEYEWRSASQHNTNSLEHTDAWSQSITLISGTGSIGHGLNRTGKQLRVGGWGYLLGDEGSGFAIGLSGLRVVCMAEDGCATPTSLTRRLLAELGLDDPKQLIGLVYQTPIPRARIASLARCVIEEANGDSVAQKIVENAVHDLVRMVQCVHSRLEMSGQGYSLALSGGVLVNYPRIVESIVGRLHKTGLSPVQHHIVQEPVLGAILLASRFDG
jgi:N-acetylglucosamine kinase-like BadF-type ATPase